MNQEMSGHSNGTTESYMLISAQDVNTILSSVVESPCADMAKSTGCVSSSTEYFFLTFPITLSTCIRTLAIFLVCSMLMGSRCVLFLVKAGISNRDIMCPTESLMSNPRSANTVSPGMRLSRKVECSVRCLSLVRPPHPSDIKLTVPCGVIPIKYFTVLWCLYDEYV